MKLAVAAGIRVDEIDDEIIVLDRAGTAVHHLSGGAAEALGLVRRGIDEADVPEHLGPVMAELLDSGIVIVPDWTRRRLLKLGAAGVAGAGIITVALPSAAAAASGTVTTELRKTINGNNQTNPSPTQICVSSGPTGNSVRGHCVFTRTEGPATISVTVTMSTGTSPPPNVFITQSSASTCWAIKDVGTWGTPVLGPQTFRTTIEPGATTFAIVFFLSATGGGVDGWSSFPATLA